MTVKKTGNLNFQQIADELKQLNNKEVLVGFFGKDDPEILTIVGANEYGATIRPKNGEWLWIPNVPMLKQLDLEDKSPRQIEGLFIPKGKRVACINDGGELRICFWLKKQVQIPARPFIRNALRDNQKKYKKMIEKGLKKIVHGKMTAKQLLDQLGAVAVSDIQKSAVKLKTPENAPVTIWNKKSKNPLISAGGRGGMISKVTYQIIDI